MPHPPNHPENPPSDVAADLVHTAVIAGYAIQADALAACLPGKTPGDPTFRLHRLGSPGQCQAIPEMTPWLSNEHSPFADRFSIDDGVARLIPPSMNGRATLAECFKPMDALGGVADALSLRFHDKPLGSITLLYLRSQEHDPFSGPNLWMLKHLMPAIAKDVSEACRDWQKRQAWDPSDRLGRIPESPQSIEELLTRLSKTERLVLDRLRLWETEREVAQAVGRSPHTVHVHVKSIYRKLMVTNRRQLLSLVSNNQPAPLPHE